MRQHSILILLIALIISSYSLTAAAVRGGIQYSIPIDYSKLSEKELDLKARDYFFNGLKDTDIKNSENITNALFLYTVLEKINPAKVEYYVKLGILYDRLEKDRHAKGNFCKAISINSTNPETYFYFGEFYYRRENYRKALIYYNKAYVNGFNHNYDTLYKIGDIYEIFGDSRSALKYYKEAYEQSPNKILQDKIKNMEEFDSTNREFYSDTRLRG